ncbi:unnamed protein product [Caenorhabditis brenneri]
MEENYQTYDSAQGTNPYYEYHHNGMVYYQPTPPQQHNMQWVQDFNQPAPPHAFVAQPTTHDGYHRPQYVSPPQYHDQQLYQQHQNGLPGFEQLNQRPNNNEKLCVPCRTVIKRKLIPVLHELGCLDQSAINEMSVQCPTETILTEDGNHVAHGFENTNSKKNNVDGEIQPSNVTTAPHQPVETEDRVETLPAKLAAEVVQQQSNEQMEVGAGVLEAATQDIIPKLPEGTVAEDIFEEQEDQRTVFDISVEMETNNPSKTNVIDATIEEPEFNINEIEFGYTPEASVETATFSTGLSSEEFKAVNSTEYEEEFPSLAHMDAANIVGPSTISKTLKKKLKKEKSIEREEKGETAAPPAAKKHQRKPKCFITKSDLCAPSDVPMIQLSNQLILSAILKKDDQPQNKMSKSVPHKKLSENVKSSSREREMGHRASETTGKKQSAINDSQPQNCPKSSSTVLINSNALKSSVNADQSVSKAQKKDTILEKGMNCVEKKQRYMSKAARRQLNKEKAQKQQQKASSMMLEELALTSTVYDSIDDGTEIDPPPLISESSFDEMEAASMSAQESDTLRLNEIQEIQTTREVGEAAKVEVLPAKARRLMFNSNLREKKKAGKRAQIKDGHVNEKEDSGKGHNMENDGYEQQKEDHSEQPSSEICVRNGTSEVYDDFLKGAMSERGSSLEKTEETSAKAEDGPNTPRENSEEIAEFMVQFDEDVLNDPTNPVKNQSIFKKGAKAERLRKKEFWVSALRTQFLKKYNLSTLGKHKEEFRLVIYSNAMDHIRTKLLAFNIPTAPSDLLERDQTGIGKLIFEVLSFFPYISRCPELLEDYKHAMEHQREGFNPATETEEWEKLYRNQEKLKLRRIYEDVVCLHKEGRMRIREYSKWINLATSFYFENYNRPFLPTVEVIRRDLVTGIMDCHLEYFIGYINRQTNVRFLGKQNIRMCEGERWFSNASEEYNGNRYTCKEGITYELFDETIAALKNDIDENPEKRRKLELAILYTEQIFEMEKKICPKYCLPQTPKYLKMQRKLKQLVI